MPSASVSAIAAMSGPSMRRAKMSKTRLIMFLVLAHLFGLRQLLRGRLLVQQVVVEHLPRDRPRGRPAVPAVLHQDRHRELRIVGRREGDEERVVPVLLLEPLLVVLLVL